MMKRWIWAALAVELVGFVIDAVWHGVLHPDWEPRTVSEVLLHVATVHFVFDVGVVALFVTTAWALVRAARHGAVGGTAVAAFLGSVMQSVGGAWDFYEHLQLSHGGPMAWTMLMLGPFVTAGALLIDGRTRRTRQLAR